MCGYFSHTPLLSLHRTYFLEVINAMSIKIGEIYDFRFGTHDDNEKYTPLDGIYKVLDIYSYTRILEEDVDLYELTFSKVNILKDSFESEVVKYKYDNIYMLESVLDGDTICIPESLIIGYPSPDVKEYPKIMLSIDLGVFDSPETVLQIEEIVKNTILQTLGSDIATGTNEPVDPKVSAVVYMKEWMSVSDYLELRNNRKKVIEMQLNGSTSMLDRSLYARYINTLNQLEQCKSALVAYYEKMSSDSSNQEDT